MGELSTNGEFSIAMFEVWAPLRGRAFLGFLGWGCNNVHVFCVQGDATWMLR